MKINELQKKLRLNEKIIREKISALSIKLKSKGQEIEEQDAQKVIAAFLADNEVKNQTREITEKLHIKAPKTITVNEFANRLQQPVTDVIATLMANGVVASINEEIDFETAAIIAEEYGATVEREVREEDLSKDRGVRSELQQVWQFQDQARLKKRPPVVTVMGHVDHGKTTLLDAIRETNVVAGEHGGITQHIGAYQVREKGKLITFLDTPGHEAFTAMRQRGAKVTDVAILIVAADDGVKPQTAEAIKHIKEAKIPFIVAINKIDKPGADVMRVKKELADHDILTEEWGGKVVAVEISAKQKKNIDELLDMILLVSEMEELKADQDSLAIGTVIESNKTPGKGIEATVLVQNGTLRQGDAVIIGTACGHVRSMENAQGKKIDEAYPSTPVKITGLSEVPLTGDILRAEIDLKTAKAKAEKIKKVAVKSIKSEKNKDTKKLNIVLKADVQGSLEAIMEQLAKIVSDDVEARIINYGVGRINESDIMMAASANALVLGFGVSISPTAKKMADDEEVEFKMYKVIYELLEEVVNRLNKMVEPEIRTEKTGELRIKAVFFTEKGRMVVGGDVINGRIINDSLIKVRRQEAEIGQGRLKSLQSGKVETAEVSKGNEAGVSFVGNVKIKEGDVLESWKEEKIKREIKMAK